MVCMFHTCKPAQGRHGRASTTTTPCLCRLPSCPMCEIIVSIISMCVRVCSHVHAYLVYVSHVYVYAETSLPLEAPFLSEGFGTTSLPKTFSDSRWRPTSPICSRVWVIHGDPRVRSPFRISPLRRQVHAAHCQRGRRITHRPPKGDLKGGIRPNNHPEVTSTSLQRDIIYGSPFSDPPFGGRWTKLRSWIFLMN